MSKPSLSNLFFDFMRVGCLSFGGAQAFARRVMVEERRWLTELEYAELLALAQVLPGPNVGNFAVMFGRRLYGLRGAVTCVVGFFGVPLCLLIGLVFLYRHFGELRQVDGAMRGVAAAAAGMVLGTALRMGTRLRPPPEAIALALAVLLAAAVFRVPLLLIVLVAAPLGIWAALRRADLIGQGKNGRGTNR
jgi:chromate transporter